MATDRQDQSFLEITIRLDPGVREAAWETEHNESGVLDGDIAQGRSLDASAILQQILMINPSTNCAAQGLCNDAMLKLSFCSTNPEDYTTLSSDALSRAPDCFVSMDTSAGLEDTSASISKLTFWIPGPLASAMASRSSLEKTNHAASKKARLPGRL